MTRFCLAALVTAFVILVASATRHNSQTWDEIYFPATGARGFATGDFSLVIDQSVLMQYVYGLPVYLSAPRFPPEIGWDYIYRYPYARAFYWGSGNDPDRIARIARLTAVLMGALLVIATYVAGRRAMGRGPALLAAALVAFMPEVLAHSGLSYNDMPLALAVLVATVAADSAARRPAAGRAALAGVAAAIAVGVKATGIVVLPIFAALVLLEALSGRAHDAAWRRGLRRGIPMYLFAAYLACVVMYRGDFRLAELVEVFRLTLSFSMARPSFLLGRHGESWWYFFPVVFFLKTPVAFHVLMALAAFGVWRARRSVAARAWLGHPLRVPIVGASLFMAMAMVGMNIGFRHVMPVLPFVCLAVAQGLAMLWQSESRRALRFAIAGFVAWAIAAPLPHYPYFISYVSEYLRDPARLHEVLVDSSTDWGQGLIALRGWMALNGVESVALSYFGSAPPEAYGIRYDPMPGHNIASKPAPPPPPVPPRYVAISVTNLAGNYLPEDPYAAFRQRRPVAVVGGSIYIFEIPR